jgi:2-phospho-L-lactate guanylyltransferase
MIAAVIPVKRLSEAKSRLSTRLSSQERAMLVADLLRRTIGVLQEVEAIERIGVATEEQDLVDSFTMVDWLPDMGGLNASLAHAASWATSMNARSVLMLPGDLPLLDGSDIRALLTSGMAAPNITIAPTQDGGTGAILLSPPGAIAPVFGPDSFRRHIEEAHAARISVRTVVRTGFSRELDTTEDLEYLGSHAAEFGYIPT